MSQIIMTDDGLKELLSDAFGLGNAFQTLNFHLFANDHVPVPSDDITVYTEPADPGFPGYLPQAASGWNAPTVANHIASIVNSVQLTWTPSSDPDVATSIYGVFATDATNETLFWAERFDAPMSIASTRDTVSYVPTLGDANKTVCP